MYPASETYENNLLALFPEVAALWHPTKNGNLRPEQVRPGSAKVAWWLCKNGHEWQDKIHARVKKGSKCLTCFVNQRNQDNALSATYPELIAQWHPTKNGKLTPANVIWTSYTKVWWLCPKGHEWQARVYYRVHRKHACPHCKLRQETTEENNLAKLDPEVAALWHPTENFPFTPQTIKANSLRVVWWLCDKGHSWQESIATRRKHLACPYCEKIERKTVY